MANFLRRGGGGDSKNYLIKDGIYIKTPTNTGTAPTQGTGYIRIFHNGGTNTTLTTTMNFSSHVPDNCRVVIEFDTVAVTSPNTVLINYDTQTNNTYNLARIVEKNNSKVLMSILRKDLIVASNGGGSTYARCDIRITNMWYEEL
ncbi:MAG: hypothetical protein GX666_08265 [Tissierellia bacterium]|nr:hypothetical protein [Tissierellia bacterium]